MMTSGLYDVTYINNWHMKAQEVCLLQRWQAMHESKTKRCYSKNKCIIAVQKAAANFFSRTTEFLQGSKISSDSNA